MIAIYLPEGHAPPLKSGDGIPRRQTMWMTENPQFDLRCCRLRRRTLVLLPSLVTILRAREQTCGITVAEVLVVVVRESRVRFEDPTDSEVSIEWTWTGTMIGYLGIHTCGTPLAYLQVPMLVTANGEFGIARDGQSLTTMILNINRAAPLLTPRGTVGTRITTTDHLGGRTKIASGTKVDLGRKGTGDLSSVIPPPLLVQQAPGRLGRNAKRGNCGNGVQEGGRRILRPRLAQIADMTRERL